MFVCPLKIKKILVGFSHCYALSPFIIFCATVTVLSIKTKKKNFANMFAICKHIQPDKAYKITICHF